MAFQRCTLDDAIQVVTHAQLRGFAYMKVEPGARVVLLEANPYPGDLNSFVENRCRKLGGNDSIRLIAAAMELGQVFIFNTPSSVTR